MGFCTPEEHADFLRTTPLFEKHVVSQGIRLIKYFFDVSQDVQEQRFLARKGSASPLEAQPNGRRVVAALVGLHRCVRGDDREDGH